MEKEGGEKPITYPLHTTTNTNAYDANNGDNKTELHT
jgi:hypothetical protein